jgi:hypothetical protein
MSLCHSSIWLTKVFIHDIKAGAAGTEHLCVPTTIAIDGYPLEAQFMNLQKKFADILNRGVLGEVNRL